MNCAYALEEALDSRTSIRGRTKDGLRKKVNGLEVHCELKTNSKMFSASPVTFSEDPNTMIKNEVDMGMTGTLPCLNKRGGRICDSKGHALHMEIDELLCLTVRTTIILTFKRFPDYSG